MLVSDTIMLLLASGELRIPGEKLLTCSNCISFKLTRMVVFCYSWKHLAII